MAHPVSDEALQLRKRARRRLVGAVALVAIVVLVVPWFIDTAPPPALRDVEIVIPPVPPADRQFPPESAAVAPRSDPDATTPAPVEQAGPVPEAEIPLPEKPAETPPSPPVDPAASRPADKVSEKPREKSRAVLPARAPVTAAPPSKGHVIQLGAYADRDNATQLLAKVRAAGLPGYVEPVKTPDGTKTRVRCGPFGTPEAAQAARAKLLSRQLGSGELKVVQVGQ